MKNAIPDEIIYEILKRLLVKTLCRFRAVSKRWLCIITSRPFIDSHYQLSKLNPTRLLGFHNNDTTPPTIFSTNYYSQTSSYNLPDRYYSWCSISPRGLICFYDTDTAAAVQIWNPSTGEHIDVNPPPLKLRKTSHLFLGFDPVSKKHKLLSSSKDEYYVFTLGENKWRNMDCSSYYLTPTFIMRNCCIDGIVYYLARRDDELVLVRFNVGSEIFLEPILVPRDLVRFTSDGSFKYFTSGIYVYRGTILLLNYDYGRNGFQMWVLEDVDKWSPKRFIPWQPPSPEFHYSIGYIDGEELLCYSYELAANSDKDFLLCSYNFEKGSSSSWTETIFPDLKKILDGSASYKVGFYYFVNTLESLKP